MRFLRYLCLIVAVSLAVTQPNLALAAPDERGVYQVGVARVEITPEYPIRLGGFASRSTESEGVSQQVYVRAMAIGLDNASPLVLIAVDSLGVRKDMVDAVATRLAASHGIVRENVALTFTHSHCTPMVNGAASNIFGKSIPAEHWQRIDRYTAELTDHITTAAQTALEQRSPARIEWGVGKIGFAKNRRTRGGPVDHELPVLVVRDAETKQPRAIYTSYACHCVTLSFNQLSGDWAGYASEILERQFPGTTALVSIGAGSDADPAARGTVEIARRQGSDIAAEVTRLLETSLQPITGIPRSTLSSIPLPFLEVPSREKLEALVPAGGPAGYNATTQLARLERGEELPESLDYPIQTWTFGDSFCMTFLAGEVCVDYSLRLKRLMKRGRYWLNTYSNDFCAYIPSERLLREGGYGAGAEIPYFGLSSTIAPGVEQRVIDEVLRQTPACFRIAEEADPASQGRIPRSPEASRLCLRTHDDLVVELAAAEPLVTDPVAIDFGTDGTLWVAQMNDYGHGPEQAFTHRGSVQWLRDSDRDGRFDQAGQFVSGLRYPTDVKVWRDGLLICDAPDILLARDVDGDGQADSTEVLFSGFATHNAQARVNSLRFGLDNWMYGACGLFGGKITSHRTGQVVDVTGRDFRFHPDTGLLESVTGTSQQGRCRDDWGNWFGCTNGNLIMHYPTVDRYQRRNPFLPPLPSAVSVASAEQASTIYGPPNQVRFKLSGQPGTPTSACGLGIYRDDRLGPDYAGNAFTCEPVHQAVHRLVLNEEGLSFLGQRAAREPDREFLTSTDNWFRPVQVRSGPQGGLWIVDMYRYVIEHPIWIPTEQLAELNVFAGQGMGRLYRVVRRAAKPAGDGTAPPTASAAPGGGANLEQLSNEQLVMQLAQPNGTLRDLAHQMLIWRDARDAIPALRELSRTTAVPLFRLHALAVLEALQALDVQDVEAALTANHPEFLCHAMRLAEPWLAQEASLQAAVERFAGHDHARVRRQAAWSLGEMPAAIAADAIARSSSSHEADPAVRHAALTSVSAENVAAVWHAHRKLAPAQQDPESHRLLTAIAARMGNASLVREVLRAAIPSVTDLKLGLPHHLDAALLTAALEAADARTELKTIGDDPELSIRWQQLHAAALDTVRDEQAEEAAIQRALGLLGLNYRSLTHNWLGKDSTVDQAAVATILDLVVPQQPQPIQLAAIDAASRRGDPAAAIELIRRHASAGPATREAILDALLGRAPWTRELLAQMKNGLIPPSCLDPPRRQKLLTHIDEDIKQAAAERFDLGQEHQGTSLPKDYQAALTQPVDISRGRELFRKHCATCHHAEEFGHRVGPDLAGLTNRDSKWLLTAILAPSRDVDPRYFAWNLVREDGRTVTGMIVEETSAAIRLREAGGSEHVILRAEIDQLHCTNMSAMPDGLERELSPPDMASVIGYVASLKAR